MGRKKYGLMNLKFIAMGSMLGTLKLLSACLLACMCVKTAAECKPDAKIEAVLKSAAAKHDLDHKLLRAIASIESCFGTYKVNVESFDYGLMQINYRNILASGHSTEDFETNDVLSIYYAANMLKKYRKNAKVLPWECRYNIGYQTNKQAVKVCEKYMEKLKKAGYVP